MPRRGSGRIYSETVESTEPRPRLGVGPGSFDDYGSPLTPPGLIDGYGRIFRAAFGPSGWRRTVARTFAFAVLSTFAAGVIGVAFVALRALL